MYNIKEWEGLSTLLKQPHGKRLKNVISQGIGACQKLSGGSILDLCKLQDPRTLGYLLIFGLYSKPIAYC